MNTQHKQIEDSKSVVNLKGKDLEALSSVKVLTCQSGFIAQQIINIAQEIGIETDDDSNLIEVLAALNSNTLLPSEIIIMVSEIVSCLYKVDDKTLISKDLSTC